MWKLGLSYLTLLQWLLYLMCEDEPEIVVLATRILARVIVTSGNTYTKRFHEKSGGVYYHARMHETMVEYTCLVASLLFYFLWTRPWHSDG